jgi:hypothetical protein
MENVALYELEKVTEHARREKDSITNMLFSRYSTG